MKWYPLSNLRYGRNAVINFKRNISKLWLAIGIIGLSFLSGVYAPAVGGVDPFVGSFVDDSYAKRSEGYDWVSVTIEKIHDHEAYIKVRSRSDKKRGTCTFDGVGFLEEENRLSSEIQGNTILFTLWEKTLTIAPESDGDEGILYFFCSGGATLAGDYRKLDEPLDTSQITEEEFTRTLSLQGIEFDITGTDHGFYNMLLIRPEGLELDNRMIAQPIEGKVRDTEIEDLNGDGSPEIFVYVDSVLSATERFVYGYSVNNRKSVSQIAIPEIVSHPEASEGYRGGDEFAVVETRFCRRFPIFEWVEDGWQPLGTIRQVQYKLVDGEASRRLEVEKVTEFPSE